MEENTSPKNDLEIPKWQKHRLKDIEKYRKRKREYATAPEQRAKRTEYMRIWREKNREKHNQQAKESHQRNKHKHLERNKNWHLLREYGITLSEKQRMIAAQDGKCKICKNCFSSEFNTHLDHCHITQEIRGILCNVCNTKLGWLEKYKESILEYLKV